MELNNKRESWIFKQHHLLELEKLSERAEISNKLENLAPIECEELGISILNLEIESSRTSLYGRTCLSIQRRDKKLNN